MNQETPNPALKRSTQRQCRWVSVALCAPARAQFAYISSPRRLGQMILCGRTVTRYSDGWRFDPSIGEYVQRLDDLREHLGKKFRYDEAVVDRELAAFQVAQGGKLNVRSGPNRIVKIRPNGKSSDYPESGFRDIPQWKLTKEKRFVFVGTAV